MQKNYLVSAFKATVSQRFPAQKDALTAALAARLAQLRAENADASKKKQRHLEGQILPGIAVYETLQTVMPRNEALQTVHGYVEQRAWKLKKAFLKLMRIPGLYRKVPGIFCKETPKLFGETGRLCRAGNPDLRRRVAHRYDALPLSRRLRALWLSRAVPLLLRQR